MDHSNVCRRQIHISVVSLDSLVVPFCDLAEKNVCDDVARKTQWPRHTLKVVGQNHCAQYGGNVKKLTGRGLQISIGHRRVRRAKVNRLRLNLLDPAARANRLIIDTYVWMKLAEFTHPLLIKRIGKRRAGALQADNSAGTRACLSAATGNGQHDERSGYDPDC